MPMGIYAYDITVDGIYYNILSEEEKTLSVTNKDEWITDYVGDVEIPSSVEYNGQSWSVVAIEADTFKDHAMLNSIVLPEGIKTIPDYAFRNCNEMHTVVLPNSIDSIGNRV